MRPILYNKAHTVGLVEIEDEDPYQQMIEVNYGLLKDALKMLDPYKPDSIKIGLLKTNGTAGVITMTLLGQRGSVAVAGMIQECDQKFLDDFRKETTQE